MNSKSTSIFVFIALGLAVWIALFEKDPPARSNGPAQPGELLPELSALSPSSIELELPLGPGATNRLIRAAKSDGRWRLEIPDYPALPAAIENFLDGLARIQRHGYIPPEEFASPREGLAPYGLQPPLASVSLRSGTNLLSLNIGGKTLVGGHVYAQILGNPGVFIADADVLGLFPASSAEWRDPMLVSPPVAAFDRLVITNGSRVLELSRPVGEAWRLVKPLQAPASENRLQLLVRELAVTRIRQFVSDGPRADLDALGLLNPETELTLALGTNPVFQLQFGRGPANLPSLVYARRQGSSSIFLVEKKLLDIVQWPYEEFRDRTLVSFTTNSVNRIEIKAAESFVLQRESSGNWRIIEPYAAPADTALVHFRIFEQLSQMEIKDFAKDVVTDFSAYGLNPPAREYVLKRSAIPAPGATNDLVAQVDFSTNSPAALDRAFARRSGDISVYVVAYGEIQRLPQSAYELRDRRIWNLSSTNIHSATVAQRGRQRKFVRGADSSWSADPIANTAIEESMHRLGRLYATEWNAEGESMYRFLFPEESTMRITLNAAVDGKLEERTVEIGKLSSPGAYATVMIDGRRLIFKLPPQIYEMVALHLRVPDSPEGPE